MASEAYNPLKDEQGNWSTARMAFWTTLLFTFWVIWWDTEASREVPAAAYALLSTVLLGEIGWAGGPRMMQHVGKQLGGVAAGVASAARRFMGTDDRRTDDERG